MFKVKRILSVSHGLATREAAAERAALLAKSLEAELRIQSIVFQPLKLSSLFHLDTRHERSEREALLQRETERLEGLASVLDAGARTEVDVQWGQPFDENLLEIVGRFEPDLVVVQPRDLHQNHLSHSDWRFLRRCPVPVLLARGGTWPAKPGILVCVDPVHDDDKQAVLDRHLIEVATAVAGALDGRLTVLHACGKIPGVIGVAQSPEEYEAGLKQGRLKLIRELIPGIQDADIHVRAEAPDEAILAHIRREEPQLVVMGLLARSRLKEMLIGSTARAVIPELAADTLLIKPPR